MKIAIVYIFAILFPIVVGFFIYRAFKKYNNKSWESQEDYKKDKEQNKK